MRTTAEIKLWGTTIGAVTMTEYSPVAYFEYDNDFIKSGIQVSPLNLPLQKGVFSFPELNFKSFHGLPGLLADSLPDKFGNQIIDLWLTLQGRQPQSFNAVERLCYTGKRGMGALEFFPAYDDSFSVQEKIHVDKLVELASLVLQNRSNLSYVIKKADELELDKSLAQIINIGTSAGGARAKALVAWNPEKNEIKSGQTCTESGFEQWIIKFSGVSGNRDKESDDILNFGSVEFAYYQMALSCGIQMSESTLFDDGHFKHFMTRRFDRTESGQKIHMQSLAALGHFDFNSPGTVSYEQTFDIMRKLNVPDNDYNQFFRRMVFNVVTRNQDDHVKNIAFLMNKKGEWKLSPAFDVCFAYNPDGLWTGSHQMLINGKRKGFVLEDFKAVEKHAGLKRGTAKNTVEEIIENTKNWLSCAENAGVEEKIAESIFKTFVLQF